MKNIEREFIGIKGLKIFFQEWVPESPKAVIQVVHGFGSHSGRYMNVVNELVPRNYVIYADDHRGHGRSEGERNYVESFDHYVEDEKILHDLIKKEYPNLPIFMLGHSMGSFITLCFTKKYENLLNGLILSGVGIKQGADVGKFKKIMARFMSKIAPHMKISTGFDPKLLSHDPEVVKAYENDPLVNAEKITTGLGFEILKYFNQVITFVNAFKLPLLIQCGSEDKLVGGIENFKDLFTMQDKTIKIYTGLYHEVYNEVEEERKMVLKDLSDWLEKHI